MANMKFRFSPRQQKFLWFYFSGFTMAGAASAAGYRARSVQGLSQTGGRILRKLTLNPMALFLQGGEWKRQILDRIIFTADHGTLHRQLVALEILMNMSQSIKKLPLIKEDSTHV